MPSVIRGVIARRLKEWMEARVDLDTQMKVSVAAGVSQTTVSRILLARTGVTIDNLEAVAAAFGREPWELILPPGTAGVVHALQSNRNILKLPQDAQERIAAFVDFTAQQAAKPVLNDHSVREVEAPMKQAVKRAAARQRQRQSSKESVVEQRIRRRKSP